MLNYLWKVKLTLHCKIYYTQSNYLCTVKFTPQSQIVTNTVWYVKCRRQPGYEFDSHVMANLALCLTPMAWPALLCVWRPCYDQHCSVFDSHVMANLALCLTPMLWPTLLCVWLPCHGHWPTLLCVWLPCHGQPCSVFDSYVVAYLARSLTPRGCDHPWLGVWLSAGVTIL